MAKLIYPAIKVGSYQVGFLMTSLYAFSGNKKRGYSNKPDHETMLEITAGIHIPMHWLLFRLDYPFDPMCWDEQQINMLAIALHSF